MLASFLEVDINANRQDVQLLINIILVIYETQPSKIKFYKENQCRYNRN
jgi:hypothetical protein